MAQPVMRAVVRPLVRTLFQRGRLRFDPRMLFSAGQAGLIYPTELATLYQDSAGATAATATSQPLGLTLDSRLNLALGGDLVTNGNLSNGTTSWTSSNNGVLSVSNGELTITNGDASNGKAYQMIATEVGKTYLITCFARPGTASATLAWGTLAGSAGGWTVTLAAARQQTLIFTATVPSTSITLMVSSTTVGHTASFDDISVREIPGNHAFQTLAIDRPILQNDAGGLAETYNGTSSSKVTPTGGGSTTGFFWCGALRLTKTGSAQTLFSSAGTNTGYRVRINASNQLELAAGNGGAFVTVAASASLAGGERFVLTAWHDGTTLRAQVNSGTVAEASMGAVTAGTAQITIGKDNNAASSYFGGWLYYQLHRQTVPTDSEIAQLKRWIAARVGVTL